MGSAFFVRWLAAVLGALAAVVGAAQELPTFLERLPAERLDVAPPASRVRGEPGRFAVAQRECRAEPAPDVRRRIVDLVVQEWAFFGFPVFDERDPSSWVRRRRQAELEALLESPERLREILEERAREAARVAPSIAGYWAVTAEGGWIVERHNADWRAAGGLVTRWRDAWSAAFISWVMCEAGLGNPERFQRAIAHHTYIDQAIRARDGRAPEAVLVAYEVGEQPIVPGDLVCLARRPAYRTLEDRRRQIGVGARTHCDFVVKVDEEREVLLAIGGNVRGTVGLKLLPAERRGAGPLRPVDRSSVPGAATTFVHLKLRAEPIEANAFDRSATVAAMTCASAAPAPAHVTAVGLFEPASSSLPTAC